jgi:CRISPR system Cascade subunit CasB
MAEPEQAAQLTNLDLTEDTDKKTLPSIVGRLAYAIDKILGTGEVADLRRLRPEDPASPAYWKTMVEYWDMPFDDDDARRRACLLSGLARTKGLFDFHTGLGKALAIAEYSELRFVRLLRADGKSLLKEIELMAEFLNSKAQRANWSQVAEVLFTKDDEKAESARRRIARDYYGNQNKKKES